MLNSDYMNNIFLEGWFMIDSLLAVYNTKIVFVLFYK